MKSETTTTLGSKLVNKNQFFAILTIATILSFEGSLQAQESSKKLTLNDLIEKAKNDAISSRLLQIEKNKTEVPVAQQIFSNESETDLKKIKPPKTNRIYSLNDKEEADYEKTLNLQMTELYKMTEKYRNSPNRGELWLRLGELYVEKAVIIENRRQLEYDQKLNLYLTGKLKEKPILDLSEAREYNKNAIQLYSWYIKDYPKDNKAPQALYFLGYNNFELDLYDLGTKYYSELIQNHKNSSYVDDAHFALAERDFEKENWTQAYKSYAHIIKNKTPQLYFISLYKAAWCLYRLGQTTKAIQYLDYIVKNSQTQNEESAKNGVKIDVSRLENDAVKDLALFLADLNDVDKGIQYFQNLKNKYTSESLERFGNYLSNNGNYEGARKVFKYLINKSPLDKKAFDYQHKIVQNYFFSKNIEEFKNELYLWLKSYNNLSAWYAKNQTDKEFVSQSDDKRESTLRKFILVQHQNAQKTLSRSASLAALDGYKVYFEEFGGWVKNSVEMRFFYAELLYDFKKYDEAVEQYLKTANSSPNTVYGEKSLMNALIALQKIMPSEDELQKNSEKTQDSTVLSQSLLRYIEASELFLKRYPKANNAAEVRFRIARLYFLTKNFKEAEQKFLVIIDQHPKSKYAQHAINLIIDIYTQKKDYDGLIVVSDKFLKNNIISESKQGDEIREIIEKAKFKKAQDLEANKRYLESAEMFSQFANNYTKSELAAPASFNAAVNYEKAEKLQLAIINYKKVIDSKTSATKSLKNESKRLLVKIYEQIGAFSEAAEIYSDLSKLDVPENLKISYTFNSAYMYETIDKTTEAIHHYESYLKLEKNTKEINKTYFKIAELYKKNKDHSLAIKYYQKYANSIESDLKLKVEAMYNIYQLSKTLNEKTNIESTLQLMKRLYSSMDIQQKKSTSVYLAKLELSLAESLYFDLKRINIPLQAEGQKIAISKKLESLNRLTDKLTQIVKYDSTEEIIQALYLLGVSNFHVAQSLSSVPVPESLNAEQKKQYLDEISKIISPFYKKADESFISAVAKGRDLRIHSKSYFDAYSYLALKYPNQYFQPITNLKIAPQIDGGIVK